MLSIKETHLADETKLELRGILDLESTPELKSILSDCMQRSVMLVRIDMSGMELISSSGVGALMNFHQELSKAGGRLVLERISEPCLHVLDLLRLTDFFEIA
jgi:anti-anti-sigma factor